MDILYINPANPKSDGRFYKLNNELTKSKKIMLSNVFWNDVVQSSSFYDNLARKIYDKHYK